MPQPSFYDVTLSADEANVLFQLLGRWAEDGGLAAVRAHTVHEVEVWALNDLYCALERVMVPGVEGGVAGARARIMAFHGDEPWPSPD
jgi:hypothetical protein